VMRQPEMKSLMLGAARQRQREIEGRLVEYGLLRGPRHSLHSLREAGTGGEADYGRRLSAALARLGPVFSAFGLYLSTRVDLLPVKDCLALADIPDRAPAMPGAMVWELIGQEMKRDPAQLFCAFETTACQSRLLFQVHHARLLSGEAVEVRLKHGEAERDFERDAESLPLLKDALDCRRESGFPLENVIADFRRAWHEQCDFLRAAEMMAEYGRETAMCEWLRAPLVHRQLCTPRLLVIERLPGVSLEELIAQSAAEADEMAMANAVAARSGMDARHLAARLCLVWLQQSLEGRLFPVSPRASEIVLLPNQQFAFTGSGFARLPAEAQANLSGYLIAASTQGLDRACTLLLRETNRADRSDGEDGLRRRLRQIVPFRDGEWDRRGGKETFAEHLFLHCRLAAQSGYSLRRRSQDFFGGLFLVAAAAQTLAPAHDPLLEGLEDLRVNAALAQFRGLFGLRQMGASADKYAAVLMELPKKLDEALTLVAAGCAQPRIRGAASGPPLRRKNSSVAVVALMMLLIATGALSHHLSSVGTRAWADEAGALVFVMVGALLLRIVSRKE
jgi:predicted unusual protein kinase regulating ubiquinone biosynthesis (AarF/ABC1/UbiB family)